MTGDFMPPVSDDVQHGQAMQQSIMQFIGHAQQGGHLKHGIMHGSMHFIGQSTQLMQQLMLARLSNLCAPCESKAVPKMRSEGQASAFIDGRLDGSSNAAPHAARRATQRFYVATLLQCGDGALVGDPPPPIA